jgi:hypothetical protein
MYIQRNYTKRDSTLKTLGEKHKIAMMTIRPEKEEDYLEWMVHTS